jgi:hypothetical protein
VAIVASGIARPPLPERDGHQRQTGSGGTCFRPRITAVAARRSPLDRAPRRELDWSILEKNPLTMRLGRWEEHAC